MIKLRNIAYSLGSKTFIFVVILLVSFAFIKMREKTYLQRFLGKNPNTRDIAEAQAQHSQNSRTPFWQVFLQFKRKLLTGENPNPYQSSMIQTIKESLLATLGITLPSLILGFFLAFWLASLSLWTRIPRKASKLILDFFVGLGSLGVIGFILLAQSLLCLTRDFQSIPLYGWDITNLASYLSYACLPISILTLSQICFYAPLFELSLKQNQKQPYSQTLRAIGCSKTRMVWIYNLKSCLTPALSHTITKGPSYLLSSSLLVENSFNIPGMSFLTYEACLNGDGELLLMLMALIASLYLFISSAGKFLLRKIDSRTLEQEASHAS